MDISGSYLYSQNETSFVTSRMRFVGKLPLIQNVNSYTSFKQLTNNLNALNGGSGKAVKFEKNRDLLEKLAAETINKG